MNFVRIASLALVTYSVVLTGCTNNANTVDNRVVLYCSVDEAYAKPLVAELEKQTGLQIDALYDTEATKTAGLANRIRAEKARPRADVFWSSALLQTLLMSEEGLLAEYQSPKASDLPKQFQGKDWAGVGVRARVVVAHTDHQKLSNSLKVVPNTQLKFAHSNPQFGTASDQFPSWGTRKSADEALRLAKDWKSRGVRILPGNGDVARATGDGDIDYGLTDTDDFLAQKREEKKIYVVQTKADNVLVPGAVSMLKDAPHSQNAKKLFDAIVSAQNEVALTKQMPGVFSLRRLKDKSNWQSGGQDFSFLMNAPADDYTKWPANWRQIREPLNTVLKTN